MYPGLVFGNIWDKTRRTCIHKRIPTYITFETVDWGLGNLEQDIRLHHFYRHGQSSLRKNCLLISVLTPCKHPVYIYMCVSYFEGFSFTLQCSTLWLWVIWFWVEVSENWLRCCCFVWTLQKCGPVLAELEKHHHSNLATFHFSMIHSFF